MNLSKVLVVGVRKEHATMLKEMFKDSLSIDCITDNKRQNKHITNQEAYAKIINMVRFSKHSSHFKYRKHQGYLTMTGGFSGLRVELQKLC